MAEFRRTVVLACAALTLVPLSACSKDAERPTAASLPSSSASASLPPRSTTSASASSSLGPCNAPLPPSSAVNVTRADGDFNGDSTTDSLTVYGTGTLSEPAPYHLQIELADSHGTVDTVIADVTVGDASQTPRALGGADISSSAGLPPDGSGDEAFVTIGAGASVQLVGIYQLLGCTLQRLTGPQGNAPSSFAIGGTVTHLNGLRCDGSAGGQRLVELAATSNDGISYETRETRLEVQSGSLTPVGTPITDTVNGSDPRLQGFGGLDCPGVQAP